MVNNPITYALYKASGLLKDTTGGIDFGIPLVMGNGMPIKFNVADLMRTGALAGGAISSMAQMIGGMGGGGITGRGILNAAGVSNRVSLVTRGSGTGLSTMGGATVSESGSYAANADSSDVTNKTMTDQTDSSNAEVASAVESTDTVQLQDVDAHVVNILEILKKHKVNFNHQNNNGDSCLHKAIKNNNIEIIDFLLETGLNVNLKNKLGETAGFYIETEDLLDKLIKVGLNINATNNKHESLLHIYAKTNNKKLYTKLIDLGADENIKDINNETPSDIAKRLGYHNLISYNSDTFGFSKVIGMQKLKEELYEMVIEPLKNKEEYQKYGLAPANGILLHGLPGCGKTFIAKALAEECGRNFYEIKSSDISSPYYGGATQTIKQVFEKARNNPPSIIFIDEMEGVAPNRETLGSGSIAQDNSERVNELLQQMNNLSKDNIFVIGATNNPEKIDSAIKRPGRIDRRVFVAPPDIEAREGLFKMQLKKRPREVLINYNLLASKTEYYTAEEIKIIVDNAAKKAKKIKAKINMSHLLEAINKVKPSLSKSEIEKYKKKLQTSDSEAIKYQEKINTSKKGFNRVVGMKDLKNTLINDVIVPMQVEEERFKKYGIEPINGMILYGPPGTGKTFIAEAFAEETERFFIKIEPSNIVSKWYGESTSNIKKAFEQAEYNSPAVIFIDEIESLAPSRNSISIGESIETTRTVNELLQQLNNLAQREIFVIAATNNPDEIDEAIKRVGRFDKMIFVPPPDAEARREFFKKNLENKYIESNIDYEKLANLTEYFTIAEIQQLVIRESAQKASKMNSKISEEMLIESIKNTKPKLNKNKVEYYKAKADN